MNWLRRITGLGEKIKRNIQKKFPSRSEQEASNWRPLNCCNSGPLQLKVLEDNLFVCPNCSYHHYVTPTQRFNIHFGKNNWTEIKSPIPIDDPLGGWVDTKPYTQRLKEARKNTGQACAVLSCKTTIKDIDIVVSAVDFKFIGGSIASAEGENILQAVSTAISEKCPYIFMPCSGGMRMMESLISLSQMPRMTIAINELKQNNLPYLVCFLNPTAGGTTASIASTADINMSEKGATIAFSGKRVIAATIKEPLPSDFQTAEWTQKHGFCDLIVDRKDIPKKIYTLLSILLKKDSAVNSEENETSADNSELIKQVS